MKDYSRVAFSRVLILAAAVIATALPVHGFEVVSPDGGFSYQLPRGWKLKNAAGARYKVAVDPHEKAKIVVNTTLAIYVFDNPGRNFLPIAVEKFRSEALKKAAKRDPDFKVIENSKFTTNSNQQGLLTLVRVKRNGVLFHDSLYFFQHYAMIVWVVCSGPGDGSMDNILGRIADYLVLTRYIKRLLIDRNTLIKMTAETDQWQRYLGQA